EKPIQMNFQGSEIGWLGTIPSNYITMGTTVSYYITAEDTEGNFARSQTYTFSVPHPIRIFNVTYREPMVGSSLEIKANIESTAGSIAETQINYTKCNPNCGSYSYVQMLYSDGKYVGNIPGSEIKEGLVQFHIYASDSAGNRRESRTYSIAIGGAYYKPNIDGNNDFPESARKHTGSGSSTTDIVGVWICNDDDFLYMGIELGADVKANTTQDFVGVYFEDYSSPNASSVRYGGSLQTGVRLEVGWWDLNSFYCEHTYSGSAWVWVKNVNSIFYSSTNRFLEFKIQRVEDTHAGWNDGRTVGLYVATARESGSWLAGSVTSRITYTFAANVSSVIDDPVELNEPPVLNIISPKNGTKCSGLVVINGTAYDSDGYVSYVNLTFASSKFSLENKSNWSFIINVSSVSNGNYSVDVIATDNEGATAFARIWLIVDNSLPPNVLTPYCAINYPTENAKLKGIIEVIGNATLFGSMKVYVKIENGAWNLANGTSSWRYVWNTTAYPEGEYTLYAKASDGVIESKVAKVKIIISYIDKNHNQKEDSTNLILILVLVGTAIVIILGAVFWYIKSINKKGKKSKKITNEKEK
ncbi:MAG: Ig-like domain-containing protein, partial [Thermoplasmata archaeon]